MYRLYGDFETDPQEIYAEAFESYDECYRWFIHNLEDLMHFEYESFDIIELDFDKCTDDECKCHHYIGQSVFHFKVDPLTQE